MPSIHQKNISLHVHKLDPLITQLNALPENSQVLVDLIQMSSITFEANWSGVYAAMFGDRKGPRLDYVSKNSEEVRQSVRERFKIRKLSSTRAAITSKYCKLLDHHYEATYSNREGLISFKKTMSPASDGVLLQSEDTTMSRDWRKNVDASFNLGAKKTESGFVIESSDEELIQAFAVLKRHGLLTQAIIFNNQSLSTLSELPTGAVFLEDGDALVMLGGGE